ncbi:MAG TPA: IS5 family transposase [Candidatus Binatia bacterium]|nr:IS5 family transposase [Candidatus Binatia bacterium]
MRGADDRNGTLFSYVDLEDRIPPKHPLRTMRAMVEPILRRLSPRFDAIYSKIGRPSVPPEQLLRASLLQVLYSVRSERMLMEQLEYNLLFRWFVGLGMDQPVWHATVFSQNRDRLMEGEIAQQFLAEVVEEARRRRLLSDEHFTVDGTLLEAWASQKSFQPKDGPPAAGGGGGRNPDADWSGQTRSNQTHQSTTDPDARLMRKGGDGAKLCYSANALMDNRHGLIVDTQVRCASGTAERESALEMLARLPSRRRRRTVGADKGYDERAFVHGARALGFTPHVARKRARSAIDGRTTRHEGYAESQKRRKCVEENFGWQKTVGIVRKLKYRGRGLVDWIFAFSAAVYDLVRIRNLAEAAA